MSTAENTSLNQDTLYNFNKEFMETLNDLKDKKKVTLLIRDLLIPNLLTMEGGGKGKLVEKGSKKGPRKGVKKGVKNQERREEIRKQDQQNDSGNQSNTTKRKRKKWQR